MQAIEQVFHGTGAPGPTASPGRCRAIIGKREMKPFDDAAYTMAAVSAVVALYRALVKNGVLPREEAVRALLDEAVSRAIQAEAQQGEATTNDLNRQCAEILKFIAEKL
ncbi:MAG: hypothetical protein ACXU8R_07010 [Xanthobacteraceae bacterium]